MSDNIQAGAETIRTIQQTAVKAAGVMVHELPDRRTFLVAQDGKIEREGEVAPPKTCDRVCGLADLSAAFDRIGAMVPVWHCGPPAASPGIIFVVDIDEHREEAVFMPLRPSRQYKQLQAMNESPVVYDHAALIRQLKHDWKGCVSKDMATIFKSVNFETLQRAHSQKGAGLDSLDSSVQSRVTGEATFPEEFFIKAPLYNNADLQAIFIELNVGIEIDVNNRRFILQLAPGELEQAIDKAHAEIGKRLAGELPEGTPIIHGNPSA